MGVPREPVRLVANDASSERMVGSESGKDWTQAMVDFNSIKLEALRQQNLSGFIFKSRSPSCGPGNVPLHHEQENRRHLDQEMINVSRLFNAIKTANEQVIVGCENSPVLFGPKKGQSPSLEILRNHLAIPLRDRSGPSPVGFFPERSREDGYRWKILKTAVSPS